MEKAEAKILNLIAFKITLLIGRVTNPHHMLGFSIHVVYLQCDETYLSLILYGLYVSDGNTNQKVHQSDGHHNHKHGDQYQVVYIQRVLVIEDEPFTTSNSPKAMSITVIIEIHGLAN